MAEITAALVKELRDKTGAGMMDSKRALVENGGDFEAAVDWLRKKGLAAAAKKSGRVAAEGLVGVATIGREGAAVEVNSETDFVARNERFQAFTARLAELAAQGNGDVEALKGMAYPGAGHTVADELTSMVATIGENMTLRRAAKLSVGEGLVASYVHNALAPNVGKIGVLVSLESSAAPESLRELGRQLAMHVAAARPEALNIEDVDPTALDRERQVLADQARATGKSEDIIAKMVEGRLRKYYEEVVLLEQIYVIDGETKVRKVVENASKQAGAPIKLTGFVRFALGEGIEKDKGDFAAEVAAQLAT